MQKYIIIFFANQPLIKSHTQPQKELYLLNKPLASARILPSEQASPVDALGPREAARSRRGGAAAAGAERGAGHGATEPAEADDQEREDFSEVSTLKDFPKDFVALV